MKLKKLSAPVLLLLPAFVVLAAVIVVPLLFSFYSSFTPFRLTKPESLWIFVGLRNYITVLSNWDFWVAFGRTVLLLTVALNTEMLLGLGLALLVNKATHGQRLLRTIMMFPMMFSPVLVGFQFKFMFNDNIGFVNNALQSLGLTDRAIPWLIDGNLALISIIIAEVWSSTAVFAILILAGLLAMPKDPVEAAHVDGCTPWQTFRYVTWPYLMPFAFIAMTIRSLDVARAYDIVKIMTDGGPAKRTELLWTLIGRTAYADARMGMANAMAYVAILLSIVFTVYFFRKLAAARQQIGAEW
ncbi:MULTISPECIES: sugar ABC transporter permease [Ensifer]|jgi:multiple sugar transport system permease protein|uniref:ABC transporter permease subunit n=1 Tax=Ensifer canadensis TaxID=555315 RepID=A0AAW4FVP6_9HYPH|nr:MULTISPECIES: sugar ABC transporter permease [Ensifer]AHK45724.1 sugar ABC transporter, permease protein, putative [Ensifer adhaerens OV14]MDP9634467.1 multiple sugar transport system permease protein [Ensifer adhaerens]KQW50854.1 sugar ABC transporter permease [Ensifer sp. Root1252]KQW72705.1 sugar ABC transporter permease [Ensifer sp. Root127]KQY68888.1 sugar ABC transporter permease [Ensifer sp. Root142]